MQKNPGHALLFLAILACALVRLLQVDVAAQPPTNSSNPQQRIGWTSSPVTTANTNRDGSGTVYRVIEVVDPDGQYIDTIKCYPLGTNAATEAVLIGSDPADVSNAANNFLLGNSQLAATTLGTATSTDVVTFQVGAWFPPGFKIYALVHTTQAAGRQFVAFSDPSYQSL